MAHDHSQGRELLDVPTGSDSVPDSFHPTTAKDVQVMPLPKPCYHHGCPNLVRGTLRCPVHEHEGDKYNDKPTTTERGYGAAWQRKSKRVIARDGGVCQLRLNGCTGRATTADHIVPKIQGGTDDDSNLQAACNTCNASKGGRLARGAPNRERNELRRWEPTHPFRGSKEAGGSTPR